VIYRGIAAAILVAGSLLAQLQSQTNSKPVQQNAATAPPAVSTSVGPKTAKAQMTASASDVPESTQLLLPGCEASRNPRGSPNRDYSTPSSRLVGRWASRDPESAAVACHYFGPIDELTKTGVYVKYWLEALDEKTGVRSPLLPGKGQPPPTVSWGRTELRYQIIDEDPSGYSITLGILPTSGDSTASRETHYIACDGTSDSSRERMVQGDRYVDDKNLACSDGDAGWKDSFSRFLAGLKPSTPAPAAASGSPRNRNENTGKWHVITNTSAFDDSKTVVLSLNAQNSISGWPGVTRTPILMLRCKEGKTEAYVGAGMQGKTEFLGGEDLGVWMRGRYDQDEPARYLMSKSTDGREFFFPHPIEEIKQMIDHSSWVLEFTPFNSSPVEMRFDLNGLGAVLKPLRDACSW